MNAYRVEYVQLAGWEAYVAGLLLAENEDWILFTYLPGDYVVDGYILVAKRHIVARGVDQKRRQIARVLKLKGIKAEVPKEFAFGNIVEMLRQIEQRYKLFQIADEEDTCFCGQLRDYDETHYRLNALSPRAEIDLDYDSWFGFDELMTVEFDTNYLNSLLLLWQDKAKRKWKINQRNQSN